MKPYDHSRAVVVAILRPWVDDERERTLTIAVGLLEARRAAMEREREARRRAAAGE